LILKNHTVIRLGVGVVLFCECLLAKSPAGGVAERYHQICRIVYCSHLANRGITDRKEMRVETALNSRLEFCEGFAECLRVRPQAANTQRRAS
jgi:hypothetical protein